jgi:hypothetical protein
MIFALICFSALCQLVPRYVCMHVCVNVLDMYVYSRYACMHYVCMCMYSNWGYLTGSNLCHIIRAISIFVLYILHLELWLPSCLMQLDQTPSIYTQSCPARVVVCPLRLHNELRFDLKSAVRPRDGPLIS